MHRLKWICTSKCNVWHSCSQSQSSSALKAFHFFRLLSPLPLSCFNIFPPPLLPSPPRGCYITLVLVVTFPNHVRLLVPISHRITLCSCSSKLNFSLTFAHFRSRKWGGINESVRLKNIPTTTPRHTVCVDVCVDCKEPNRHPLYAFWRSTLTDVQQCNADFQYPHHQFPCGHHRIKKDNVTALNPPAHSELRTRFVTIAIYSCSDWTQVSHTVLIMPRRYQNWWEVIVKKAIPD